MFSSTELKDKVMDYWIGYNWKIYHEEEDREQLYIYEEELMDYYLIDDEMIDYYRGLTNEHGIELD